MKIKIYSRTELSEQRARELNERQTYWWLRDDQTKQFVHIGFHRATAPLLIDVNILPGKYTLGFGGRFDYRRKLNISIHTREIINGTPMR